jgi:hypothetical protein
MTVEGRRLLARLRKIAAEIAAEDTAEDATIEEQKASYLRQGKGFTDPRTGITYFPRRTGCLPEKRGSYEQREEAEHEREAGRRSGQERRQSLSIRGMHAGR